MGKIKATLLDYNTSQRSLFVKNLNDSVAQSERVVITQHTERFESKLRAQYGIETAYHQ